MNKERNTQFSKPGNYLIFRSIRFLNRMNPYSLTDETFADTELRKISRKRGKPTRIYDFGIKEGNPFRSGTVMVGEQRLFGNVGYALRIQDGSRFISFEPDMNLALSGYGKKEELPMVNPKELLQKLDDYVLATEGINPSKVNEVILKIKPQDITFIYFSSASTGVSDKHGLEPDDPEFHKLCAIFLQKKFQTVLKMDLPIYEYSKSFQTLKEFHYREEDVLKLLSQGFQSPQVSRDLVPLILTFEKSIRNDQQLLNFVKFSLHKYSLKVMDGQYDTNFYQHERCAQDFINRPIFALNCQIYLAKALRSFELENRAQIIAQKTLKQLLHFYASPKEYISRVKPLHNHGDIHLRNFLSLAEECRKILPQQVFEPYREFVQKVFDKVGKVSAGMDSLLNLHLTTYRIKYRELLASRGKKRSIADG